MKAQGALLLLLFRRCHWLLLQCAVPGRSSQEYYESYWGLKVLDPRAFLTGTNHCSKNERWTKSKTHNFLMKGISPFVSCKPIYFTFHFMMAFFFELEINILKAREQRWVSVSKRGVHRNCVNIFLVIFLLFLRQLSFRCEAGLGRLNVKHMYWLACRHVVDFSQPVLNNRFCLGCGSLPKLCRVLSKVWEAIIFGGITFPS